MSAEPTGDIARFTVEELQEREGETDWARVRAMTEEEIDAAALADPDAQPTSFEDWEEAVMTPPMTFLGDGEKGDE